jgi:hypothetical protein
VGFSVTQSRDPVTDAHVVTVQVRLSLAESNSLFLAGDALVSWPAAESSDDGPPESGVSLGDRDVAPIRTGMFVSELARLAHGLKIRYRQAADAERAAQVLRLQLCRAGIEEET